MAFDGLKRLLGRTKEAGQELLNVPQLSEQDMVDPSTLPNEQLAGAGLGNVLKAAGRMLPGTEDMPTILSKENAAQYGVDLPEDIKMDPTMGIMSKIPSQRFQGLGEMLNPSVAEFKRTGKMSPELKQKLESIGKSAPQVEKKAMFIDEDPTQILDLPKLQAQEQMELAAKTKPEALRQFEEMKARQEAAKVGAYPAAEATSPGTNEELNNAFKEMLKKRPIEVNTSLKESPTRYHSTKAAEDFTEFKKLPEGIHLGTSEQANARLADAPGVGPERILPLKAKTENPIQVPDMGNFSPYRVAEEIKKKNYSNIPDSELDELMLKMRNLDRSAKIKDPTELTLKQQDLLSALMKKYGHDSLVYDNMAEGAGKSYVVFDPNQVRSINAKFDKAKKNSPNLMAGLAGATAGAGALSDEDRFSKLKSLVKK